jgi:fructokinase
MTVSLVSIGEVLWDVFPNGEFLGGAPANVAFHAGQLGARTLLVSSVGNDARGARTLEALAARGLSIARVRRVSKPTGTVSVRFVAENPLFTIAENVAWDDIELDRRSADELRSASIVSFGTLAWRTPASLARVTNFLRELRAFGSVTALGGRGSSRPLLVYDVNLRPPHTPTKNVEKLLGLADLVKLSEDELDFLGRDFGTSDPLGFLLASGPTLVAVTRGSRGASLRSKTLDLDHPGFPSSGAHPVGAGDAFTAALAVSLASGASPSEALERANRRAAWVAGVPEAMPRKATLEPRETRAVEANELHALLEKAAAMNDHFVDLAPLFGSEKKLEVGVTNLSNAVLHVLGATNELPSLALRWSSGMLELSATDDGPSAKLDVKF